MTVVFSKIWQIIIEHYTVQQHIEIIRRIYHQNSLSVRATCRARREIYGQHHLPTEGTTRRIVRKFETIGSVVNQPTPVRRRNARSDENIVAVRENVSERSKSLNSSSCTRTSPFSDLNLANFE